jgi:hypothetical protein
MSPIAAPIPAATAKVTSVIFINRRLRSARSAIQFGLLPDQAEELAAATLARGSLVIGDAHDDMVDALVIALDVLAAVSQDAWNLATIPVKAPMPNWLRMIRTSFDPAILIAASSNNGMN